MTTLTLQLDDQDCAQLKRIQDHLHLSSREEVMKNALWFRSIMLDWLQSGNPIIVHPREIATRLKKSEPPRPALSPGPANFDICGELPKGFVSLTPYDIVESIKTDRVRGVHKSIAGVSLGKSPHAYLCDLPFPNLE